MMKIYDKLTIENSFGLLFWLIVGLCFTVQVALCFEDFHNIIVLYISLNIFGLLYFIVKNSSLYNSAVLLSVLYIFSNIVFAFIIKTALLQPVSSNLFSPTNSYFTTFLAFLALLFALLTAKKAKVGRPIFKSVEDAIYLKWLSIYSFVIGFSAWILNSIFLVDRRSSFYSPSVSFGGIGYFTKIYYMSIIAAVAYVIIQSNKKKTVDSYIIFLFGVSLVMAFVNSRKIGLGFTMLSYLLPCIFFRGRVTKNQIVSLVATLCFAFFVFTPIAHTYRTKLWFLPFPQRIEFMVNNYSEIFSIRNIIESYNNISEQSLHRYNYFDRYSSFFDRFATVQINDDLISSTDNQGLFDSAFYLKDYTLLLPGFIYPNKDTIAIGDRLRWLYGLKKYGLIGFSTAPLISNGYAVGKHAVVFLLCFYIFVILFLVLKKVGWNLYENVFAIFFLFPLIIGIHQFSHDQFITKLFREIPVGILCFWFFHIAYVNILKLPIKRA